jgi:hypothetical protein
MEGTTATPTTSTGTTSAPASAPSTGTPSATATPTPAERPTFAQAFAQDAATTTPDASTSTDAATTQPVDPQALDGATNPSTDATPQGPVPLTVHQKALENARTKAVEQFRQTAGVDQAVALASKINGNAPGFWREYTTELLSHPQHGPALRSELARMFGA